MASAIARQRFTSKAPPSRRKRGEDGATISLIATVFYCDRGVSVDGTAGAALPIRAFTRPLVPWLLTFGLWLLVLPGIAAGRC